jgi:HEAT repeat protein
MTSRRGTVAGVVGSLIVAFGIACATDSAAQTTSSQGRLIPDDTVAVAKLLATVRNADPLFCELVSRNVDQRGSWSYWGSMGSDPLVTDTASATMLKWVQGKHNDPVIVPRLRAGMRDTDACVRRVSSGLLAHVDHAAAKSALLDALDDSRVEVREVAAFGLGIAEYPAAVDALIERLRDSAPGVRRASAWALGAIEQKKAVPALMGVLSRDGDARVRQTAAWAIGNIK